MIINTAVIDAENTFTAAFKPGYSPKLNDTGDFTVSLAGVTDSTVTLQRSFDAGVTWKDVKSYTDVIEEMANDTVDAIIYRLGVKTGDYGSDTITAILAK